jgi:mono/diheme cytochrome c family protein
VNRRIARAACVLALGAWSLGLAACDVLFPHRSQGEKLWRKHCADCHGIEAAGNTVRYMGNPWMDLRDSRWKEGGGSSSSFERVVRLGIFGSMPAFPQLTRDEVRAIYEHLRVLRGERRPGSAG